MLALLRVVWEAYPDMRLGQLVACAAKIGGMKGWDVFSVEDKEMEAGIVGLADVVDEIENQTVRESLQRARDASIAEG